MDRSVALHLLIALSVAACAARPPPGSSPSEVPGPGAKDGVPGPPTSPSPSARATPPEPTPVVKWNGAFAKPESIVHDADADRYLVSNINGVALANDNNGFISVLAPDGQITDIKWIEGGKKNVTLDAPKGLVIVDRVLYATDITTVRMFDLKSGAPKGEIVVAGATSLNDITAAPDGRVYVSDTGKKIAADGKTLEPNGQDAVYVIEKGKAKPLAKSTDLGEPNGVLWTRDGLVVVTNDDSGEIYRLDETAKKKDVTKLPAGTLDGLLQLGDSLLVTSWKASAIYRGKLGGAFEVVVSDVKSPADIGYDAKRGRLLVPLLLENSIVAYDLR